MPPCKAPFPDGYDREFVISVLAALIDDLPRPNETLRTLVNRLYGVLNRDHFVTRHDIRGVLVWLSEQASDFPTLLSVMRRELLRDLLAC